MQKNSDLLNNLRAEIQDAQNGIGKTIDEVKNKLKHLDEDLSAIEGGNDVIDVNDLETSDLRILPRYNNLYRKMIIDLYSKNIIFHRNDLISSINKNLGGHIYEGKLVRQDTNDFREMIDGEGVVIKDVNEFRKYRSQIKEMIELADNNEIVIQREEKIDPNNIISISISVPKKDPVFIYDTKDFKYINGGEEIILDITGFSRNLLVYFLNNVNRHVAESEIENQLEVFLSKKGENRGARATYTAIAKLNRQLEKVTNKTFLKPTKDIVDRIWVFSPLV